VLVLMILNEGAFLSFISIFHKALNFIFEFDFEIAFESVPGTNHFLDFLQYAAFYSMLPNFFCVILISRLQLY